MGTLTGGGGGSRPFDVAIGPGGGGSGRARGATRFLMVGALSSDDGGLAIAAPGLRSSRISNSEISAAETSVGGWGDVSKRGSGCWRGGGAGSGTAVRGMGRGGGCRPRGGGRDDGSCAWRAMSGRSSTRGTGGAGGTGSGCAFGSGSAGELGRTDCAWMTGGLGGGGGNAGSG